MTESVWALLQHRLLLRYEDLKRRLAHQLGSSELAGDALQETWLRLERGGPEAAVRSLDTYLYRIALNIARDHRRAEGRRQASAEIGDVLNVADDRPDAAQTAEARSDLDALKMILAELPARRRAILIAARLDGLPRRDIAAHFGISERFVQRELRDGQDYCVARLRSLTVPRSMPQQRGSSRGRKPICL
jgi:RNA polymerase sigma factor, sigma-70 family